MSAISLEDKEFRTLLKWKRRKIMKLRKISSRNFSELLLTAINNFFLQTNLNTTCHLPEHRLIVCLAMLHTQRPYVQMRARDDSYSPGIFSQHTLDTNKTLNFLILKTKQVVVTVTVVVLKKKKSYERRSNKKKNRKVSVVEYFRGKVHKIVK